MASSDDVTYNILIHLLTPPPLPFKIPSLRHFYPPFSTICTVVARPVFQNYFAPFFFFGLLVCNSFAMMMTTRKRTSDPFLEVSIDDPFSLCSLRLKMNT